MYNFFNYFLLVYLIVFGSIILWFLIQFRYESRMLKKKTIKEQD